MLGLLEYPNTFSEGQGLNQLWRKDTATTVVLADNEGFRARQLRLIQQPTNKKTFSFRIPLKHIFGFCEDYNKIVYGLKHTLTLVNAIFRAADVDAGKVSLNEISWFMPHVLQADVEKFPLNKSIESKVSLPIAYRKMQCDTILVTRSADWSWRFFIEKCTGKT